MPWLQHLVTVLWPWRPKFKLRPVLMEFVVNKVALGYAFLQVLVPSLVRIIPPMLHTISFINPSMTQHNLSNWQHHHYITHLKSHLNHTWPHAYLCHSRPLYKIHGTPSQIGSANVWKCLSHTHNNLPASNQITNLSKNFHSFSTCENPSKYLSSPSQGIHFAECSCRKQITTFHLFD